MDFNRGSGFVYGQPYVPPPPIIGIITDTGLGKTLYWCKNVAAPAIKRGSRVVLFVPRHKLADEIVNMVAKLGITACVYRGRDADDPMAPGEKMCREQERIKAIGEALGSVPSLACRRGDKQCPFYETCGYQRQRRERPQMWIVPHNLLFYERPDFIPHPDALGIDETFYSTGIKGIDKPERFWLRLLKDDRSVPRRDDAGIDPFATADLIAISDRVHAMLLGEPSGRLCREALSEAGVTVDDLCDALTLEWRRKIDVKEVYPGMSLDQVKAICGAVAQHNQDVRRLTTFWDLLILTAVGEAELSPYLDVRHDEPISLTASSVEPAIRMAWRLDIHKSWSAPTIIMDATMQVDIVREFFPGMSDPVRISAPMPHTYVRQVVDRNMAKSMLVASESANDRTNQTRRNNADRVHSFIEVRANDVSPGRVLVICQQGLEMELRTMAPLPPNVDLQHFNAIAGENSWSDVALLIVIGRTEPPPQDVENQARVLFGVDVAEVEKYPQVRRGVRMRNGSIFAAESSQHPDPSAEAVRWSICEAGLIQAIGRGRGINRTADNPLKIDILTKVALPIETDEMTTWDLIQPTEAEIMRSRGAIPLNYRDMATAYPDLFPSDHAAQMALLRENPSQTPIEKYLIGECDGFRRIEYRRKGSRGPASKLLYKPTSVADPAQWLAEHIGEVVIKSRPETKKRKPEPEAPTRKCVRLRGVKPLHFLKRTIEDIQIGGEAWVSFDSKLALPVSVIGKDGSHYKVEFARRSARFLIYPGDTRFLFHDEVRTTPEAACINRVTS
jgi:putative DNA primase/helicase